MSALLATAIVGAPADAVPNGQVLRAGGDTAVAGSFIVVLRDDAASRTRVAAAAGALAGGRGATVVRTFTAALRGFEISGTAATAARIAADPSVAYVEQNHTVRIAGIQTNPPSWGLDRIDQRNLPLDNSYSYPNVAGNVHAYVIDTGIRTTHGDFRGRVASGFDSIDGGPADDCNGHGTHVAGTIGGAGHGVAKAVRLVAVRVLDCAGRGTTADVIAGIDWVTANAVKPAVANLSLGGPADTPIDTAVRNSIRSGVTYGVAAGNDGGGDACTLSPARVPEAITVGATTATDARSSFSNTGGCLDLFAPGSAITSAWNTSDTAVRTISGTSMATPHVVGVAALLLSANPGWRPEQVRDQVVRNAAAGVVVDAGAGSPNRLLRVAATATPPGDAGFSLSLTPTAGSTAAGGSVTVSVPTRIVSGSPQQVRLSARDLPVGVSATFKPEVVTSGESATLTVVTTARTPRGTHSIVVVGTGSTARQTATYLLAVTAAIEVCAGTDGSDLAIPDGGSSVTRTIKIASCGRNGSVGATVEVHIRHTYRGDLVINLLAPDGSVYPLKKTDFRDDADDVNATYQVDLSREKADGAWRLRIRDLIPVDAGHLDTWTLTL